MKKVLLLSASPRKEGNTELLVNLCAKTIRKKGVKTKVMSLRKMRVRSCIACGSCKKSGKCKLDDGLNEIIAELRKSRGFIVATPVYFGTARGDLMAALQRIGIVSRTHDEFLSRKVGGPIAVARRGGHTATIQELLMFYLINDMVVAGSTYWNMVFGHKKGEALDDKEGVGTVKRFAGNVAWLVDLLE